MAVMKGIGRAAGLATALAASRAARGAGDARASGRLAPQGNARGACR